MEGVVMGGSIGGPYGAGGGLVIGLITGLITADSHYGRSTIKFIPNRKRPAARSRYRARVARQRDLENQIGAPAQQHFIECG